MNINSTNSVNFQAKLKIPKTIENKERWKNIAKMFEKETANHPNGLLELAPTKDDIIITVYKNTNDRFNTELINAISSQKTFNSLIEKASDNVITKKLKKLFNTGITADSQFQNANKRICAEADKNPWIPEDVFRNKYEARHEEIIMKNSEKLNDDKFWHNFSIVI